MKVVVLESLGGTGMCLGRDLGGDDLQLPGDLPDNAERVSRITEQAFGSVGIRPTIKVTAFDLNVLEAR